MKKLISVFFVLTFLFAFAVGETAFGATLEVGPGKSYTAIQPAINAASNDDIISVSDGTYATGPGDGTTRFLDFGGKAITLQSVNGPENCIIDCQGTPSEPARGFYFHSGENSNSLVEGFTIINGANVEDGGGVNCTGSSPTIAECIFTGNSANSYGGGIYFYDSSATLTDCVVQSNSSVSGGGIQCMQSSPQINNCIIRDNTVIGYGGGIYSWLSDPMINNCTIAANSASYGGGVSAVHSSSPLLVNCILWNNSASEGKEIALYDEGVSLAIDYSDIEGGISSAHAPSGTILTWGDHNINVDPLFVNQGAGDYHLQLCSPCIDAGDPLSDYSSEPPPNGGVVNMGAYGNTPEAAVSSSGLPDTDGDGVPDECDNCPDDPLKTEDIDSDGDNILDCNDNCPAVANSGQTDIDGDEIGDACDPDTFFDDFDDVTTYLFHGSPTEEIPPTKWRQVGVPDFGDIWSDGGFDGTGSRVVLMDEEAGYGLPGMAANHARNYDLAAGAKVRALVQADQNTGAGGVGFGVYNDSGMELCGGIGAGFSVNTFTDKWEFFLFDSDEYILYPNVIGSLELDSLGVDPQEPHEIILESSGDTVTATLDDKWTLSGSRVLPIDVAGIGVWTQTLTTFSFDDFAMKAQPDDRHMVFDVVDILHDNAADQLFPAWSHDGKMVAYIQRDSDPFKQESWNVWVQQVDPLSDPVQCTLPEDNVYIYAVPAFSPDYSHVIFTAFEPGNRLVIKRAKTDGSQGTAEREETNIPQTIISTTDMDWLAYDTNCDYLLGTVRPTWTSDANLFAIEITAVGELAGTIEDAKKLTEFPPGSPGAYDPHFNATCSRVVFMNLESATNSDLYILKNVQELLGDTPDPPVSYDDTSKLDKVVAGPLIETLGRFSRDDLHIYYCKESKGVFDYENMANNPGNSWLDLMQGAHWEIFAVRTDGSEEPIKLNYYRPYNQCILAASPDGTQLVFISDNRDDGDGADDSDLYVVPLKVQEAVNPDNYVEIKDGSGTQLELPVGSIIITEPPGAEEAVISIKTPLPGDIPSPETLPGGLQNIALARVIEIEAEQPTTVEVNPDNPPILTIHYTDEEITGLEEMSLRIHVFNPSTMSWETIGACPANPAEDCTEIDPAANTVSAPLPHFSMFCLSGALQGTLPVVNSFKPPLTSETDFALQDGTTLPVKFDVRAPSGAFLPDELVEAVLTDSSVPPNRIATFIQGDGSENIRVDLEAEHYIFNLHSKNYDLMEGPMYTITVLWSKALWNTIPIGEIGFTVSYTKGTGRGKQK